MRVSPCLTTAFLAALLTAAGPAIAAATEIEPGLPPNATTIVTVNIKQLLRAPAVKQHGLRGLQRVCKETDRIQQTLEMLGNIRSVPRPQAGGETGGDQGEH